MRNGMTPAGARRDHVRRERGAVLLGALLIVSMLMVLAMLSLNVATQEVESVRASKEDAAIRRVAESGADLIVRWFHDPESIPDRVSRELFTKRYELPLDGPSFFDAGGRSQLTGDREHPDLLLDVDDRDHEALLYDPHLGQLRALGHLGRVLSLRLYGPERPGLLGTASVTVRGNGGSRTFSVHLGTRRIPPLRAAIQLGVRGRTSTAWRTTGPLPLWVHWGDVKITGDANLGRARDLPRKDPGAPVTGLGYARMARLEDRWLDFFVGGETVPVTPSGQDPRRPDHVHANQEPLPGLKLDPWDYATLKHAAQRFGTYYVLGGDGFLHPNGSEQDSLKKTPDEVFGSEAVGDHRGLVFVDTPARRESDAGALRTVRLTIPYAEGVFVVNAHVSWQPAGSGHTVPALSPPPEGASTSDDRIPVQLSGLNLQGVLVTPGNLIISGRPRAYGALSVGGDLLAAGSTGSRLEIWYNDDLRRGQVRGMPLVYLVPGTLQEHM